MSPNGNWNNKTNGSDEQNSRPSNADGPNGKRPLSPGHSWLRVDLQHWTHHRVQDQLRQRLLLQQQQGLRQSQQQLQNNPQQQQQQMTYDAALAAQLAAQVSPPTTASQQYSHGRLISSRTVEVGGSGSRPISSAQRPAPERLSTGYDLLPGDTNDWATRPIKRQRVVRLQRTPPAREMETLPPISIPSVPPMGPNRRSESPDAVNRKFGAEIHSPKKYNESKGHGKAKRGTKRQRDGSPVQKSEQKNNLPAQSTGPVKRWRCPWGKGCSFTTDNPKQVWPHLRDSEYHKLHRKYRVSGTILNEDDIENIQSRKRGKGKGKAVDGKAKVTVDWEKVEFKCDVSSGGVACPSWPRVKSMGGLRGHLYSQHLSRGTFVIYEDANASDREPTVPSTKSERNSPSLGSASLPPIELTTPVAEVPTSPTLSHRAPSPPLAAQLAKKSPSPEESDAPAEHTTAERNVDASGGERSDVERGENLGNQSAPSLQTTPNDSNGVNQGKGKGKERETTTSQNEAVPPATRATEESASSQFPEQSQEPNAAFASTTESQSPDPFLDQFLFELFQFHTNSTASEESEEYASFLQSLWQFQ
ncbi:hypothetical protein CC1G_05656 [Coprinopsis cinerea okayama7|uniref:Uncharacterized protein n=1 Tax=Coprinopsis cinerea (strain Okayama-7 / 130 / ATCC MYA-4618 / FGSC 9003) TaxID=240176 RepID=A8P1T8_COPC7|nr:hypothetical protein CC1G_05656 [Coprinopsis cinerea okayama7\|eukprot:XP_001838175.2 hypothetical protein CC1G_05656 [Coprinopsis cinerea okayama7\